MACFTIGTRTLEIEHEMNKPIARYEMPLICEVIGDHSLDKEQLIDYLYRVLNFAESRRIIDSTAN